MGNQTRQYICQTVKFGQNTFVLREQRVIREAQHG